MSKHKFLELISGLNENEESFLDYYRELIHEDQKCLFSNAYIVLNKPDKQLLAYFSLSGAHIPFTYQIEPNSGYRFIPVSYLQNFAVVKKFRGQNHGERIISILKNTIIKHSISGTRLILADSTFEAQDFYIKKNDFQFLLESNEDAIIQPDDTIRLIYDLYNLREYIEHLH